MDLKFPLSYLIDGVILEIKTAATWISRPFFLLRTDVQKPGQSMSGSIYKTLSLRCGFLFLDISLTAIVVSSVDSIVERLIGNYYPNFRMYASHELSISY